MSSHNEAEADPVLTFNKITDEYFVNGIRVDDVPMEVYYDSPYLARSRYDAPCGHTFWVQLGEIEVRCPSCGVIYPGPNGNWEWEG